MAHSERAEDGATRDPGHLAIARVLRQPPYLLPDDGVARAIGILRHSGGVAPVMDAVGRLVGTLAMEDLLPLLDVSDDGARLSGPIRPYVRKAGPVVGPDASFPQVRAALLSTGESTAYIVDGHRRLIGVVQLADLLAPPTELPRPTSAGGMATPWGVYLTNGAIQAGVGNRALLLSGAIMGLMLAGSYLAAGMALLAVQWATGERLYALWLGNQPSGSTLRALEWLALQALMLPIFIVMMRLSSLTRYHAAEHQAVHAIERGEALEPAALRRMPRVHPRCGTNLIAAAFVFTAVVQVAMSLSGSVVDPLDAAGLGVVAAFLTWRRFGAILQQYLTTSPAGEKHLASGVAAARELVYRYATDPPVPVTPWRRIWCAGVPQTATGVVVGLAVGGWVARWLLSMLS